MRRMDRYNDPESIQRKRSDKNQELYQNVSNNSKYTNIADVTNANAFEIDNNQANYRSRETYQQMKKYQDIEPVPRVKKELDDINNYLCPKNENKVYDINCVLEEARKNRQERDVLEEKRKLKNTSYNILAGLNAEELEKYRKDKNKKPTENEIRELIDTITSKTLAGEIDKATSVNLLSDLMATSLLDKVEKPEEFESDDENIEETAEFDTTSEVFEVETEIEELEVNLSLSKEILDKQELNEIEEKSSSEQVVKNLPEADEDFYTRSMDLSDKDFEMSDDFKETNTSPVLKFFIVILIIAVIATTAYFIYQRMI